MCNNNHPIDDIRTLVKVKDDLTFQADRAVLLRFTNRGTTRIWIDEDEVLDPGDAWEEGDLSGPGIEHTYKIKFTTSPKAAAADIPNVYSGNRLHIRIFKRSRHARK